jgi:methoxymalonate biosynthesis protein
VDTVKCLVWDLDQTLWRGVLIEDGEVRLADAVRDVVVELDSRGILQSIASRNSHDHAWRRLEKLGIAKYFVLPRIGWGRKSDAVRQIADRLGFAPSAVAFIDDQPAERAEVAYHLPEVRCYPAEAAPSLPNLPEFAPRKVTVDARRRRKMYQAALRREAEHTESAGGGDEDFLDSLDLVMRIGRAGEEDLPRVEELTLRTSQMNATGVHYPLPALRSLLGDPRHEVLVTTLADRFGSHGAVGVVLLDRHESVWHLELLATSCRVVSFGVGVVLLNWLTDQAARAGVHLIADFRGTDRNRLMEIAYRFAGLDDSPCRCRGELQPPADGVRRLHLTPSRHALPSTMRVIAPDLRDKTSYPASCCAIHRRPVRLGHPRRFARTRDLRAPQPPYTVS